MCELLCILARTLCYCYFFLSSLFSDYLYLSRLLYLHYVAKLSFCFYSRILSYRALCCYRIVFCERAFGTTVASPVLAVVLLVPCILFFILCRVNLLPFLLPAFY